MDGPEHLPDPDGVDLVLVDWDDRGPSWAAELSAWRVRAGEGAAPRVVLFGPHTDLEAHATARSAGLGPMWARSRLVRDLLALFEAGPNRDPSDGASLLP